jgi:pimeloyl-ACP methyl ester carboxylesterase
VRGPHRTGGLLRTRRRHAVALRSCPGAIPSTGSAARRELRWPRRRRHRDLPLAIDTIPDAIRDRFDIVTFDPRGTGRSRPIDCIDDRTTDLLVTEDPTPDDIGDLERFFTGANTQVDVNAACIARNGTWLADVGTRNVARDVDRLRAALGEDRINYLGYSYGTVLGAVYAQEFPTRVRTMVLDGGRPLRPVAEQRANAGFEHAPTSSSTGARTAELLHSDGDPQGVRGDAQPGSRAGDAAGA